MKAIQQVGLQSSSLSLALKGHSLLAPPFTQMGYPLIFLPSPAGFFGYNCQRQAHNHYPTDLHDDDRRIALDNPPFSPHQRLPEGADPPDPKSYATYAGNVYAPDLIWERARVFIRDNRERPFFLYLPTTVPHVALQVPEDSLAEYRGLWPDPPHRGDVGYVPHPSPRAAYAAMVTRLDREVGRLMDLVKELGLEENTVFVFTSDNGPLYDRLGGTDTEFFNSAAGFRGRKGSYYEGGFRVPCLVRWRGRARAAAARAPVRKVIVRIMIAFY